MQIYITNNLGRTDLKLHQKLFPPTHSGGKPTSCLFCTYVTTCKDKTGELRWKAMQLSLMRCFHFYNFDCMSMCVENICLNMLFSCRLYVIHIWKCVTWKECQSNEVIHCFSPSLGLIFGQMGDKTKIKCLSAVFGHYSFTFFPLLICHLSVGLQNKLQKRDI